MKSRALMFWLAILMVFGGAMTIMYASGKIGRSREFASGASSTESQAGRDENATTAAGVEQTEPTLEISEFELTDQLGRNFHSDQLKGKIWVGSIFFSKCPSTCRMQNAEVAKLQTEFADDDVQFVSITCDPKNDDVVTLAAYARMFNADPEKWFFLTGPYETAERIGNTMFGITVQPETHSDRLVLIGRDGKVHSTHRSMLFEDTKEIRKEIRSLLNNEDAGTLLGTEPGPDSDSGQLSEDNDSTATPVAADPTVETEE